MVHLRSSLLVKGGGHSINLYTNTNSESSGPTGRKIMVDGPLVLAMKRGGVFLADKINLAEDSKDEIDDRFQEGNPLLL